MTGHPRSQPNSELDHFDDHEKLRIALAQREIAEARIEELEGALRAAREYIASDMLHFTPDVTLARIDAALQPKAGS